MMSKNMEKPFEGILGNSCELQVIDYLLALPNFDFNISELSRKMGVSRSSIDRIVKKFLRWNILKITVKRGNVIFYQINKNSVIVREMYNLNNGIIDIILGETTEKVPEVSERAIRLGNTIESTNTLQTSIVSGIEAYNEVGYSLPIPQLKLGAESAQETAMRSARRYENRIW